MSITNADSHGFPPLQLRRLRLGMVGGGEGAFIGAVHRMAARLDDRYELVAGALSSDPARNAISGRKLYLAPDRTYDDWREMARTEAARADGIDVVAIVTPNDLHVPVALAFLEVGIHVICDKPIATSLADAQLLARAVNDSGSVFVLTHPYSAYPMVRLARQLVQRGDLGTIRLVHVEYFQDWLSTPLERSGHRQASWRTDPVRAGAGCLADIGCHAFHLASFVSGLVPCALSCDTGTLVADRQVEDNAHVLMRYATGARGTLLLSQVATGCGNSLKLRVFGSDGSITFDQEDPETLWVDRATSPRQRLIRAASAVASPDGRLPVGHPEGLIEAFAQLYSDSAALVHARLAGMPNPEAAELLPGARDGVLGMMFSEAALASARTDGAWQLLGEPSAP